MIEKVRSANYFGMSLLLHSTAIVAIALGPTFYPQLFESSQPSADSVEVAYLEDTQMDAPKAPEAVAPAPVSAPAPAPAKVEEAAMPEKVQPVVKAVKPQPKVESKSKVSKSNALPEKKAVESSGPLMAAAQAAPVEDVNDSAAVDPRYDALVKESDVEVETATAKKIENDKADKMAATLAAEEEARKASEQAEKEELRQQVESAKAEAQAATLAAQAEKEQARQELEKERARIADEQEKSAQELNAAKAAAAAEAAEAAKLAAQARTATEAAQKAEADAKASAAKSESKAASVTNGNGTSPVQVKQNFLSLRQMPGNKPPRYTQDMRVQRLEGRGQLIYFVSKQGAVTEMRLAQSTGSPELDHEALDAFRKYKFVPGQEGYTVHNFEFKLSGPAQSADGRLRSTSK